MRSFTFDGLIGVIRDAEILKKGIVPALILSLHGDRILNYVGPDVQSAVATH